MAKVMFVRNGKLNHPPTKGTPSVRRNNRVSQTSGNMKKKKLNQTNKKFAPPCQYLNLIVFAMLSTPDELL